MDPLQKYLQEQSSDGKLDSIGNFTLVWEKAQEKLRQFQLESPAHYVLKLVQAAVSARATRIDFKIAAKELYCYFTLASHSTELGLDSVASALASPPSEESPLRHLIVGLNASFMGEPKEILWGVWGELEGDAILFGQKHSDRHSGLPHPLPNVAREGEKLFCFRLTRSSRSGSAQEHALLVERCGYSPVPIYIDGKMIDSGGPDLKNSNLDISITRNYFLLRYLQNPSQGQVGVSLGDPRNWLVTENCRRRPSPAIEQLQTSPYLLILDPEVGLKETSPRIRCTATASLHTSLDGNSFLHLVRFGVSMKAVKIPACPFGAQVVLSGEKHRVDLSEFAVVVDEALSSTFREAKALLAKIGTELLSIKNLPAFPQDDTGTQAAKLACCCIMGSFALPMIIWEAFRVRKRKAEASGLLDEVIFRQASKMARLT